LVCSQEANDCETKQQRLRAQAKNNHNEDAIAQNSGWQMSATADNMPLAFTTRLTCGRKSHVVTRRQAAEKHVEGRDGCRWELSGW
jgi:hypothetical protein